MAVRLRRVDPIEVRDRVVEFFWRMRAWPYPSIDDYYRNWDWRYTALSEPGPVSWIAEEGGQVVGHMGLNFRTLSVRGQRVRAAVPGNFLLDDAYRNSMIGPSLAGAPRALVRREELDLLLGYGNKIAHSLFLGFGCKDLGAMESWIDVRRWGPVLRRRSAALAWFAPAIGAATRIRRALVRGVAQSGALLVRELSAQELRSVDRSHWSAAAGLAWDGTSEYFYKRFATSPFRPTRVYGVVNGDTNRIEGLVVTEGTTRISILECDVNEESVSAVRAVDLVAAALPNAETIVVPSLRGSLLAAEFGAAGYHRRGSADSDRVLANTYWSAYWDPKSPFAAAFAEPRLWRLWYGWSHH
jgi:hypothetical protein